jgi:hypothetical protein
MLVVPGIATQVLDEFIDGAEREVVDDLRIALTNQYKYEIEGPALVLNCPPDEWQMCVAPSQPLCRIAPCRKPTVSGEPVPVQQVDSGEWPAEEIRRPLKIGSAYLGNGKIQIQLDVPPSDLTDE